MTVMTGVGPALAIDGPFPVPRRFSLLTTPGVVVEEIGETGGQPRWMNGVNVYGYPAGLPFSWDPCAVGTYRDKEQETDAEIPQPGDRFDPFAVYFPLQCSVLGVSHEDLE